MTTRAVVFDLGHTLWDIADASDELDVAYANMRATLCARLGREDLPAAEQFRAAVTEALRDAAETYFMPSSNLSQPPTFTWVDTGIRSLGLELPQDLVREVTPPLFATELHRLVCHEGTQDAVTGIAAAGYRVGCVTNTLADRATIEEMLRLHGFAGVMSSVVVSSDEGWRKPHPSLFEKALSELDVVPEQSVFVGDSPWHDIAGAKAVGMRAVLTTQYVRRGYEGFTPPPDAVINHLSELQGVLDALWA